MSNYWFNVLEFGAKGDATLDGLSGTNDAPAIQAAVNAAIAAGGGTVYFPRGAYALGKNGIQIGLIELLDANNIQFLGDGIGRSVLIRQQGTYSNDTHIVRINGGKNLLFSDLTLDGNKAHCIDNDAQKHGLYISGYSRPASDVRVTRCEMKNFHGGGLYVLGDVHTDPSYTVKRVWVSKCRFFNNDNFGIATQRGLTWF